MDTNIKILNTILAKPNPEYNDQNEILPRNVSSFNNWKLLRSMEAKLLIAIDVESACNIKTSKHPTKTK